MEDIVNSGQGQMAEDNVIEIRFQIGVIDIGPQSLNDGDILWLIAAAECFAGDEIWFGGQKFLFAKDDTLDAVNNKIIYRVF